MEFSFRAPLIAPNESHEFRLFCDTSASALDQSPCAFILKAALFADGSYEGDTTAAASLAIPQIAKEIQRRHLNALMDNILADPSQDDAAKLARIRSDLPTNYPAFDYSTISDLILHIRYTARQGVDTTKVKSALDDLFADVTAATGANFSLLFSLSHDFPTEWSAFVNGADNLSIIIKRDYFSYFTQGKDITINEMQIYTEDASKHHAIDDPATRTTDLHDHQAFTLSLTPDAAGPAQVLRRSAGQEVFLIIRYSL